MERKTLKIDDLGTEPSLVCGNHRLIFGYLIGYLH